jgi:hypothetical protein
MLSQVSEIKPKMICIAALPPFAMSHARELYRKCRALLPQCHITICLWHFEGDLKKIAVRMKVISGDSISVTLPEVLDHAKQELSTTAPLNAVAH